MNEWGFIGHETLVVFGNSATYSKFKNRCGSVRDSREVLSNPHDIIASRCMPL